MSAPAAVVFALGAAGVAGVVLFAAFSGLVFGPPQPEGPVCQVVGRTSPGGAFIELRSRTGDGGAVVLDSTVSDGEDGGYRVATTCRFGLAADVRVVKGGYFTQLRESLPFSTDQPTSVRWDVTLVQAP